MKLIFIYGKPATGKLTVAQELAAITGYKLFHNHLAVDLLFSVFEFGSAPFVELREQIWLSVFEQASRSGLNGLIFTFAPEATVRAEFPKNVRESMAKEGGEVRFVELVCPVEELRRRIDSPSRREYQKLTSVELFERLQAEGSLDAMAMPAAEISLDTSLLAPAEAAREIAVRLGIAKPPDAQA